MKTKAQIEKSIDQDLRDTAQGWVTTGKGERYYPLKAIKASLISVPLSILEDLRKGLEDELIKKEDDRDEYRAIHNKAIHKAIALLDEQITALK